MSLWDALSAAATPLATAAGANQQGIQQGNEINTSNLMDQVKLYQQQAAAQLAKQKAQSEMDLQGAQKREADARTSTLQAPPPKPFYTVPGVGIGTPDAAGGKFNVLQGGAEPPKPAPGVMTDYQKAVLSQNARNHADAMKLAQQRMAASGGKDAAQMQMAYTMAAPAITQLKGYFAKQENPGLAARASSHLPLIGNALVGALDADYQKAQQSAEVLATQYVETLPKGRASPQLIATMQKQIAPETGDTPAMRAQKLNTILTFERAIQKRAGAAASPDNPFADLVGAPVPENPE